MIEDDAVKILKASIGKQFEEPIERLARRLVRKFNAGPKPEHGKMVKVNLAVEVSTDLLYDIEEHLTMKQNGQKRFRKKFYRKNR